MEKKEKRKKSKKDPPAEPEFVEEEEEVKHPPWWDWVEKNSKAKVVNIVRPPKEPPTPWQKPGPMKKKDWIRFFGWADTKARPLNLQYEPQPVPCEADYLPCAKQKSNIDPQDLLEDLTKLSTPLQRFARKKYEYPENDFPYSPVIVWGQPAHHDRGRPFQPPFVPNPFLNDEVEMEFWAALRFPVSKAALKARPSARILSLAKPRVTPPFPPHCPIPERIPEPDPWDFKPPPRRKFTPRGWRIHQRRLLYLAKPVYRPEPEYPFFN